MKTNVKRNFEEIILSILKIIYTFFLRIIICFVRSFLWAIPIYIIWNKIIIDIITAETITYWQSYWVCVILISLLSTTNINIKK